jgi:hypothetical protein
MPPQLMNLSKAFVYQLVIIFLWLVTFHPKIVQHFAYVTMKIACIDNLIIGASIRVSNRRQLSL